MSQQQKAILVVAVFFPLFISAIGIGSQQAGTQTKILYLYDPINTSYYQDWEAVLMQYNYSFQEMTLQDFLSNPQIASDFDLVIAGNSISDSNGNGINQNDAETIANTGKPILASSYGGWIILRLAGYPHGYVSSAIDKIEVNDSEINHTIYKTPYNISYVENGDHNEILISDSKFNDIFQLDYATSSNLTKYGSVMTHIALAKYYGYSGNPDIFFLTFNNASLLNNNGRNLVVNIIEWLIANSGSKLETSLSLELPQKVFPGDAVKILAALADQNGTGLEDALIQFYVNDTYLNESLTNESGQAIAIWYAPDSYTGNFTIYASYLGNQFHLNSTSIRHTISVIKIPTALVMETPSTVYEGQKVSLVVMLSSERGTNTNSSDMSVVSINSLPVYGAVIYLHANDLMIGQAITNESGIAVFDWSNPEGLEGTIGLRAEYLGNQTYSHSITDTCLIEVVASPSESALLLVSLGASSSFIALGLTLTVARRRIKSVFGK
ncbi:MAG: hypothetical protein ACFE7E_06320 [Candidatus Hodarchaeota archaeon]